ncbi:hypothetical protein ZTR_10450 [Talaromyces verruculosus]|nr:hypothetical protein ZTR_10450 [Talaromyces verruculosus]
MDSAILVIDIKAELLSLPDVVDAKHPARTEWALDISVPGKTNVCKITLKDPALDEQYNLCRWYLEEYVQKVPYSVDLANDARAFLEEYPKRLWLELGLEDVISDCITTEKERPKLLTLRISEKEPSGELRKTIHQLFWETLEYLDPITTCGWRVTVERHPFSVYNSEALNVQMRSWPVKEVKTTVVNVLLVIARSTSRDVGKYNDVHPFLAWEALTLVQNVLNMNGDHLKLHIEVARPGTYTSFKEHLRRAREAHGPGYFQIVHFDLHGSIKTIKTMGGKKYGFLCFSKKDSTETTPVLASSVARVLKEYEISFVILNACDSARAYSGDLANIANVFQRQGSVRNVLAMSFKISSAAVELFMVTFYQSFLVERLTFSAASRKARQVLRTDMLRPARFGVQRELLDSFVPVTYGTGDSCVLIDNILHKDLSQHVPSIRSLQPQISIDPLKVIGRDFDILRLEKELCRNQNIYLHGLAGVGKSSFLQYVSALWQCTHFVDAVVSVDMAAENIQSADDFANTILNQLLQNSPSAKRSSLWTIPSIQRQSYNFDKVKDIICEVLDTCKVIFIIDGLDILSSPFRSPFTSGSARIGPSPQEIFTIIKMLGIADECQTGRRFILVGRRPDHEWLGSFLGSQTNLHSFELQNLELPDSIELGQQILRDAGEDISIWEYEDFDWLEAIIGLLQGVPLALKEILPIPKKLSIPWREFYDRLHSGLFMGLEYLRKDFPYHLLAELDYISTAFPQDVIAFLLLFSLYWGESPPLHTFERLFLDSTSNEVNNYGREELEPERFVRWAEPLLGFAVDRGYLRVDLNCDVAWIHPLFTIYGRAFLRDFNPNLQHPQVRELILSSIQSTLLVWNKSQKLSIDNNGHDYCLKPTKYGGDANVLTSIKLCLELSSTLDVAHLPIYFLKAYISDGSWPIYMADNFMKFLDLCIGKSCTNPKFRTSLLSFCGEALSCFYENKRLALWMRKQGEQIKLLCHGMLEVMNRYSANDRGPEITVTQVIVLLILGECQDALGRNIETSNLAELVTITKEDILNHRQTFTEQIEKMALVNDAKISTDDESSATLKDLSGTKSFRQDLDMLFTSLEEAEWDSESEDDAQEESCSVHSENENDPAKKLRDMYALGAARSEVENASRRGPMDVECDVPKKGTLPAPILQALEDAADTGNWIDAFNHHHKLFLDAMENINFDEADQHINAVRHICKMTGNLTKLGPMLDACEGILDQQRAYLQLSLSLLPSVEGGHRDGSIKIHRELILSHADATPMHAFLAKTFFKRIEREQGSGAYIPGLSREKTLRLMRRHAKRFRNRENVLAMQAQLETVLETIMSLKHAMVENDYTLCFKLLDTLEQMLEKDDYLYGLYEGVDWIKRIREECQKTASLFDRIYAHFAAVFDGNFSRAYFLIDEISNLDPSVLPVNLKLDEITAMLRSSTEFEALTRNIETAKTMNDFDEVRRLNTDYMNKWAQDDIGHVEEVENFIVDNLNWLVQESMNNERWQESLEPKQKLRRICLHVLNSSVASKGYGDDNEQRRANLDISSTFLAINS